MPDKILCSVVLGRNGKDVVVEEDGIGMVIDDAKLWRLLRIVISQCIDVWAEEQNKSNPSKENGSEQIN